MKKITCLLILSLAVSLLAGLAGLAGCGYSTRSLLPGHVRTIYIAPFKNKITYTSESRRNLYLPLIEVKVREAVIDRFLFDGNLKIADEETADVVLRGELIGYDRIPLRYAEADDRDVDEYRIQITVAMVLWDNHQEEPRWTEARFIGDTTYFTKGSLAKSETVAIEDAYRDLARRIVERTVEDW